MILKNLYKQNVSCAEPEELRGKLWSEIKPEDFFCKPVIQYPSQDARLEFTDQAPLTIGCKVYGDPTPKTQWLLNSYAVTNDLLGNYTLSESTVVNHTRWVNITTSEYRRTKPFEFKCIAINFGGSDERKITVVTINTSRSDDKPSIPTHVNVYPAYVNLTIISIIVVVLLIVFCKLCCKRKSQKPLSDTELAKLNRLLLKAVIMNSSTTGGQYNTHNWVNILMTSLKL